MPKPIHLFSPLPLVYCPSYGIIDMLTWLSSFSASTGREMIYYFGDVNVKEEAYNEKLVPSGVVSTL